MQQLNPDQVIAFYQNYVTGLDISSNLERAMGICPFHEGDKKASLSISLSTGMFKCFSAQCGMSGNVITFAKRFGIQPPDWAGGKNYEGAFNKSRVNDRELGREYLIRRGISSDYVYYLDQNEFFACDSYDDEDWIMFPVFDTYGHVCALNKVRYADGEKKTFGSYVGGYWIDGNYQFEGTVHIVEGVINAITLNSLGYMAMSIITAGNVLDYRIFAGMDVCLMFDNDSAGRTAGRRFSRGLINVAKSVRSVSWDGDFSKGFDANDVLRKTDDPIQLLGDLLIKAKPVNEISEYIDYRKLISRLRLKHAVV